LFAQWLQGYEIDTESVRVVLKTLRSVFPKVEVWYTMSGDFLLIAAKTPVNYDASFIQARLTQEPYKSALPRAWLVEGAAGVFSRFVTDNEGVTNLIDLAGIEPCTDDANYLEYAFARNVGHSGTDTVELMLRSSLRAEHARPPVAGAVDWDLVDELRGRGWLAHGSPAPTFPVAQTSDAKARSNVITQACLGNKLNGLADQWEKQALGPRDSIEMFALGEALAHRGDAKALDWAGLLAGRGFNAESALVRARYLAGQQRHEDELAALEIALGELRREALPLCTTVQQVFSMLADLGKVNAGLARRAALAAMDPLAIDAYDATRRSTVQQLAFQSGDPDLCVRALGVVLDLPRWNEDFLRDRLTCLEKANHPYTERARDELLEFLEGTAGTFTFGPIR
jgi:hypothetical protein